MILRKKIQFNAWLIISALALVFSFNACRDDQFDEPPITGEDPGLNVNMTLDSLKTIYKSQLTNYSSIPYIKIDNDWTIKQRLLVMTKVVTYIRQWLLMMVLLVLPSN